MATRAHASGGSTIGSARAAENVSPTSARISGLVIIGLTTAAMAMIDANTGATAVKAAIAAIGAANALIALSRVTLATAESIAVSAMSIHKSAVMSMVPARAR